MDASEAYKGLTLTRARWGSNILTGHVTARDAPLLRPPHVSVCSTWDLPSCRQSPAKQGVAIISNTDYDKSSTIFKIWCLPNSTLDSRSRAASERQARMVPEKSGVPRVGSRNVSAAAAEPAAVLLDQIYQLYAAEGHGEPCIRCTFLIWRVHCLSHNTSCAPDLPYSLARCAHGRSDAIVPLIWKGRGCERVCEHSPASCTVQTSVHGCQGLKITLCFLVGFCVTPRVCACVQRDVC
jgi:hypothetical protein